MKPVLPLFIFIDAMGWEIIKGDSFGEDFAPYRQRLKSVFGYSSACVPSIVSGRWPEEHRNWCYFVHDPARSPFRFLRPLGWLPRALTSRRICRRWLSKLVKRRLDYRGYFDLYNIPFRHISLFDFTEKKNPLQAGGMNRGSNIFDFLEREEISYHVSNPTLGETENFHRLREELNDGALDFAFVYWPELDGLLHRVGNQSPEIAPKLRGYEQRIRQILEVARRNYEDVHLYVFSDHGMANCDKHLDLRRLIEELPVRMGSDYAAVYDSTMARFWFFNARARWAISEALRRMPEGSVLPDDELKRLGCLFPDRQFGELIFLAQEGTLIVPSDMGERPIRAMHGYHPDEKHSYAALASNRGELPVEVTAIPHLYDLMEHEALQAKAANHPGEDEEAGTFAVSSLPSA